MFTPLRRRRAMLLRCVRKDAKGVCGEAVCYARTRCVHTRAVPLMRHALCRITYHR